MARARGAVVVAALALGAGVACRGHGKGAAAPPAGPGPGACPDHPDVVLALAFGDEPPRAFVHLTMVPDDQDDLFTAAEREAFDGSTVIRPITAQAARAHGADVDDTPIWLFGAEDAPPCRAELGGFVAVLAGDAGPYTAIRRELGGCKLRWGAFGLRQASAPSACRYREFGNVAASVTAPLEPLPARFAPLIPAEPCAPPACETRWLQQGLALDVGPEITQLAVAWVHPEPGPPSTEGNDEDGDGAPDELAEPNECDWPVDSFYGHFWASDARATPAPWTALGDGVESLEEGASAARFTGALYDGRGARTLLSLMPGIYQVWPLPATGLPRPRPSVRYEMEHPESWAHWIPDPGPDCGL